MTEKTWINSFRAIFVGLSFLVASLVQVIIFYYSTTLNEVNPIIKILFPIAIGGLGIFIWKIFDLLFKNARANCPEKIGEKFYIIFSISFISLVISIIISIYLSTPKAILKYSFECPDRLYNNSIIKLNEKNDGPIYGNYKFFIQSTNQNVSFMSQQMNEEISLPPQMERVYTTEIYVLFKERFPRNTTIYNNFICTDTDCVVTKFIGSENVCHYEYTGTIYLEKIE